MIVGVIDIGSNSIRLMLSQGRETISKRVCTARLGEGLAFTQELKQERMEGATAFIKEYVEVARNVGAEEIFIFATEAVRAANNKDVFLDMVKNATGLDVDVVPSSVEAKLGFSGAYTGDSLVAVVDIGGASTEITIGDADNIVYSNSMPIGCVRMRDKCGENDRELDEYIDEMVMRYGVMQRPSRAIFVAGTASTVAMMKIGTDIYNVKELDNVFVTIDDIDALLDKVRTTPMELRKDIKGLPSDRADIIYGGMKLIRAILVRLDLDGFYFSDRDNLEGYLSYLINHRGLKVD